MHGETGIKENNDYCKHSHHAALLRERLFYVQGMEKGARI